MRVENATLESEIDARRKFGKAVLFHWRRRREEVRLHWNSETVAVPEKEDIPRRRK